MNFNILNVGLFDGNINADAKFKYYWEQFADEGYQKEEDWIIKNETPEKIFSHFSIKSKVFMWNYVIKYLEPV